MKRSQFIKSTCTACAMLALPGIATMVLESCASLPTAKVKRDPVTKQCTIPIEKFGKSNMLLLRVNNYNFDFLIIKKTEVEYKTLELRCSHEDQPLTMSNKNIYCASHGSIFDFDGNALKEPAIRPLKSYKTQLSNNFLIINLT